MKIETIKKKGFVLSVIAFLLMLFTGFVLHPNLLKMEALHTVEQWPAIHH